MTRKDQVSIKIKWQAVLPGNTKFLKTSQLGGSAHFFQMYRSDTRWPIWPPDGRFLPTQSKLTGCVLLTTDWLASTALLSLVSGLRGGKGQE